MKKSRLIAGSLVAVMSAGLFTGCSFPGASKDAGSETATETGAELKNSETEAPFDLNDSKNKKKTAEIEKLIDNYFYFDEDPEKQEEKYYDGILAGLDDPYSVYYTKEEYEKLIEDDSGEYYGIGATVTKNVETGVTYVVKPIKNSPAEKAGVLPGDIFVKVDDTEITTDMDLDAIVKMIRGSKGTKATIEFYRESIKDYVTIEIERDTVQNYTVDYEMLDADIAYIKVEQFIDNTPEQFKEAVDAVEKQGAKAIIFDLRNNPGGLVTAVTEMTDYIIDDNATAKGAEKAGILLSTKDKEGNDISKPDCCSDKHSVDLPMAVLVNGNSASAAEIFTGVLRDYGVATIVGENTFGKGIVQSVIPLKDGSAIKITIAKYFIPSGDDIHLKGIAPDVEVPLDESLKTKVEIAHDEDNQLQAAIKAINEKISK